MNRYSILPEVLKTEPRWFTDQFFKNGSYEKPERLSFPVPEKGILFNSFISPKEDLLITCAQGIDSTNIDQDYYISFRMTDANGATW